MKAKFYIDRAFGHQIWINVEDGIITDFPHSGKMEDKLNEVYKGYPIAQFKEEFEAKMKPSFHCVHPDKFANHLRQESNLYGLRTAWYQRMSSNFPVYTRELCEAKIKEIDEELINTRRGLKLEAQILLESHNFKVKELG